MSSVKSLAKDTAVYGLSSIIGRFLNWLLVPLYTNMFASDVYGEVTYIYAIVAVALIVLTYGMETGFFRFANHERYPDPAVVYSTAMTSLAVSSALFLGAVLLFLGPVSEALHCPANPSFAALMAATVAIDAFSAIPFSYLRYKRRPLRFAALRLIGIALNIGLNIFFILICPWLWEQAPGLIVWFYDPAYGIGYIFLANFISSLAMLLLLTPDFAGFRWRFDSRLWREMLVYSFPLLILGIAGIMNQTVDKILLPWLIPDKADAMAQLGIYGANYKIAVVMVMFIQAFRFAYEPFIFAHHKAKSAAAGSADGGSGADPNKPFIDAMTYFIIFSMAIFLGVMFFLDTIRHFISPAYYSGLKVVPVVMLAEFFFGVFFNLSLWYKLTDRTVWGTYFTLIGLGVTLGLNILLVPHIGYMGAAWAAFSCYATMMTLSYLVGRRKYPIAYDLKTAALYVVTAIFLYGVAAILTVGNLWIDYPVRTLLLAVYLVMAVRHQHIPLPSVRSLLHRR